MKRYKFNRPLITSDTIPSTTLDVLWIGVNNNKRIKSIKEFDNISAAWKNATDINKPVELTLAEYTALEVKDPDTIYAIKD